MWGHIYFIRDTGEDDLARVDEYYYIIVTENTEMNAQYIEHTYLILICITKYKISNIDLQYIIPPQPPKHRLWSGIDLSILTQENPREHSRNVNNLFIRPGEAQPHLHSHPCGFPHISTDYFVAMFQRFSKSIINVNADLQMDKFSYVVVVMYLLFFEFIDI